MWQGLVCYPAVWSQFKLIGDVGIVIMEVDHFRQHVLHAKVLDVLNDFTLDILALTLTLY